jgi:hypothetical protein
LALIGSNKTAGGTSWNYGLSNAGTDSLAELEKANPILGERLKDFVNTIVSCCRKAYERFSDALDGVLTLSLEATQTEKDAVLKTLKDASNSQWFREVAQICDQLAAIADTYDSDIQQHIDSIPVLGQLDRRPSLRRLLEILHKHDGDLKNDINSAVDELKMDISDSKISEARNLAATIKKEITKTLTRIRGVSVRITGSSAQGAKNALSNFGTTIPSLALQDERRWYVSYAWGDDSTADGRARENIVDKLCAAAEARGRKILRDKNVLALGQGISAAPVIAFSSF